MWFQIYPRGHTDTQTYVSQYFVTVTAGEVTMPIVKLCHY